MGNTTTEVGIKVVIDGKEGVISLDQLSRGLTRLRDEANKAHQTLWDKFSANGMALFTGLNQGLELAKKALNFFSKPITLTMDAEQAQVSFEVMLGSAEAAKKMISELKEDAAKTPYEFSDLQQATKVLLNFGIEANEVRGILKMLGDVSGGDAQRLQQLALVMGQVASAGKLQGQDLLQLINAGFNPLQEIVKSTGKSMAQTRKDMEAGKISYDMVIGAFKSATSEGGRFNGMMDKQSLTLRGLFSTLMDNLNQGLINFAESGLFEKIKGKVQDIGKWFDENKEKITEGIKTAGTIIGGVFDIIISGATKAGKVISVLWDYKDVISALTVVTGAFLAATNASTVATIARTIAMKFDTISLMTMYTWEALVTAGKAGHLSVTYLLTAAQTALNNAMKANPILFIISVIAALVAIIYVVVERTIGWAKAWNYIKAAITIAWEYIKAFFNFAYEFSTGMIKLLTLPFQIMWNVASEIFGKIGSIMKKLVTGDFAGVWDEITSGFSEGFKKAINGTIGNFKDALGSFEGLGTKAANIWKEAGKEASSGNKNNNGFVGPTFAGGSGNGQGSGKKELTDEEKKAAAEALDAKKKQEEAEAKRTIENELEREQKILDIDKKYDLLKLQYTVKNETEMAAARRKILAEYDDKQADLDNKKRKALLEKRKQELTDAWGLREQELKYNEVTDLKILEEKKLYLEMVRNLYTKGSKEWMAAQRDVNSADWDIRIAQRDKQKSFWDIDKEIKSGQQRNSLGNNAYLLNSFDENQAFNKDIDELNKRFNKEEITADQFRSLYELREREHQKRLLEIKYEAYDQWLGKLAGLSKQEIAMAREIAENVSSVFGKIGDMVYNSAKRESDEYKKTETEKLKSDREKALSHARSEKDKERINKEYDKRQQQMEEEVDQRAREKAKDWYTIQKAANVASATIASYEAGAKALGNPPVGPWNIALAGIVIAAGLANVASIIATPLPGFARGVVGVDGPGTDTSDSILARISKGESIIKAESTRNAFPLLELMNSSASFAKWANDTIINGTMPRYAFGMVGVQDRFMSSGRSGISNTYVNDNGEFTKEMRQMNKNFEKLTSGGIPAYAHIGDRSCDDINKRANKRIQKETW